MSIEDSLEQLETTLNEYRESPATNTGRIIDLAYEAKMLKAACSQLEASIKELMTEAIDLAAGCLENQGVDMSRGSQAQLSFSEAEYPTVEDWDQVYRWMDKTQNYSILQRRLSAGVVMELTQAGDKVEGISMATKREPNLRKIRT